MMFTKSTFVTQCCSDCVPLSRIQLSFAWKNLNEAKVVGLLSHFCVQCLNVNEERGKLWGKTLSLILFVGLGPPNASYRSHSFSAQHNNTDDLHHHPNETVGLVRHPSHLPRGLFS